jgi:hypothetical protein
VSRITDEERARRIVREWLDSINGWDREPSPRLVAGIAAVLATVRAEALEDAARLIEAKQETI